MDTEIRIERVLPATIETVYDAWTRVELLTQWYCPNPAWDLKVQADVRVGGDYVVEMGPHVVRAPISRSNRRSGWCSAGSGTAATTNRRGFRWS